MLRITRFLYIHILLAPMIILSYYLGSLNTFFMSFGVVLIHEIFHLIAALIMGVSVKSIIILPFGMTIRLSKDLIKYPKKEIVIALAGPMANALMLFLSQFQMQNANLMVFKVINWAVLIMNLFPVPPLDGGRVLRAVVFRQAGIMNGAKIMQKISKVFVGVVFLLGVAVAVYTGGNPSLMTIGGFLVFSVIEEKRNSDFLIMHSLINEKEKFRNKKLIPTLVMCVNVDTSAKTVIRRLNLSTFYVIHIIDENQRIIKTATESDFIRAVKRRGFSVKAEEV